MVDPAGDLPGKELAGPWGSGDFRAPAGPPPGVRVRVEVLNAGGVPGLAASATDHLRSLGYDVVSFGNASEFTEASTRVIDRVGDTTLARSVADDLGVRSVGSEPDPELYVDVSVLLGSEWTLIRPEPARPQSPPWWDVRQWFRR